MPISTCSIVSAAGILAIISLVVWALTLLSSTWPYPILSNKAIINVLLIYFLLACLLWTASIQEFSVLIGLLRV